MVVQVDLILHPLRSELNFPIGSKLPLDMGTARWDLPIHLLDGIMLFTGSIIKLSKLIRPCCSCLLRTTWPRGRCRI